MALHCVSLRCIALHCVAGALHWVGIARDQGELDATSSHLARFDDKPFGDRAQTCINRGVPGLFWTSYLSLQPLLNIFLFGTGITLNGRVVPHNLLELSSCVSLLYFSRGMGGVPAGSDGACAK